MMMEKREKSSGNGYGESSPCPMMIGQMRGDHQDQPAAAAGNDSSSSSSSSSSSMMIVNTSMRTAETLLRLIPIAPCIAALVVMLHNSQTNDFGSVSYSHLGAFRYLVHVNGICAGYSLLSAAIAAMPRPPKMSQAWTFFVLDQLMTYLVLAAGAVSTEVLYLAFKGDAAITWSSACSSFDTFCHKATASVGTTFVVVVCYAVLSLISSYKLFSNYDAPVLANYPTKASIEVTTFHG